MAQTEAEPPTSAGTGNAPMGTRQTSTGGPERPLLSPFVAFVVILLAVLVLLAGGGLFLRQLTAPPMPVAAAPTTGLGSAPTLAAAPTAPPQTQAPATLAPAANPNAAPTAIARPTLAPTAQPTPRATSATLPTVPGGQAAEQSPLPTVAPELRREIETAYTQYWDARAQAVWTLDPVPLDDVATGGELLALRRDIEQLRTEGRAIKAEVQHQYVVIRVDGDVAQVLDRLRDFSIYVDPASKQPLPGQVRPDEANAPLTTSLYFLRNVDGTWRVERGDAYAND
jgi:hypothetical protein